MWGFPILMLVDRFTVQNYLSGLSSSNPRNLLKSMKRQNPSSFFFASAAALLITSVAAHSALIAEVESNNTIATAQLIPNSAFTPNVNPNVYGTNPTATITGAITSTIGSGDIDFFKFNGQAGWTLYADIDGTTSLDSIISLFDSTGTLLAYGDDLFSLDPGSTSTTDAFLGSFVLPSTQTYYLAVSGFPQTPNGLSSATGFNPLFTPVGDPLVGAEVIGATAGDSSFPALNPANPILPVQNGSYTLHVSVPEPTTALFGLALTGAMGLMRRRRAVVA